MAGYKKRVAVSKWGGALRVILRTAKVSEASVAGEARLERMAISRYVRGKRRPDSKTVEHINQTAAAVVKTPDAQNYLDIAARLDGLLYADETTECIDAAVSIVCIAELDGPRADVVAKRALAFLKQCVPQAVHALLGALNAMHGKAILDALGKKPNEQPLLALRRILDDYRVPFEAIFDDDISFEATREAALRQTIRRAFLRLAPDQPAPERLREEQAIEQAMRLFLGGHPRWSGALPLTVKAQLRARPKLLAQLSRITKKKAKRRKP